MSALRNMSFVIRVNPNDGRTLCVSKSKSDFVYWIALLPNTAICTKACRRVKGTITSSRQQSDVP